MSILKTKSLLLIAFTISMFFLNNAIAQRAVTTKSRIHYITDTTSTFDTLISRFKDKVIYVDMWATWCHPCRMELQQKNAVKTFSDYTLKNNIVMLYLCCDKDDKSWKWFINSNKLIGYHLLVNDNLIKDLRSRFSYAQTGKIKLRKGFYIPRHMIIDQKGAIIDSMAIEQGNPLLYTKLNKLVNEKP